MSDERKIFWAFAWLALAIMGVSYGLRQIRLTVFVVPVPSPMMFAPEQSAPGLHRQRLFLQTPRADFMPRGFGSTVTSPPAFAVLTRGKVGGAGLAGKPEDAR